MTMPAAWAALLEIARLLASRQVAGTVRLVGLRE